MLWKTCRHTGSEEDYAIYKDALNQATVEIINSKRSYQQQNRIKKVHDKVGPLEGINGNIITEGFVMAQNLN